ncbi:MAG: hypothetical protein MRECE_38c014 [Mycoplasmataceae bacterium CE_OT135]|nr:MAG: hypothetical protein MRECE_38c014 [Mycoplasmataceae bacterium CE_OT135]
MTKDWKDIHPDFAEIISDDDYYEEDDYEYKTYQQIWEEAGFTAEEAKQWITAGFKPKENEVIQRWKNQEFNPQQTQKWIQAGWELSDSQKAKDWKDQGFTPQESQEWIKSGFDSYDDYQIAKKWREQGFTSQQAQGWLNAGLSKKHGANFAKFLLTKDYTSESFPSDSELEELKEDYVHNSNDWSVIDKNFAQYQQCWEKDGFTYKEAKEWMKIGLGSIHNLEAKRWKKKGFSPEQTKLWFDCGLGKNDFGFADWLVKEKRYQPQKIRQDKVEELRDMYYAPWADIDNIDEDFGKYNYHQQWEECNFTAQETKEWIQVGIMKDEAEFALYLKQKGFTSDTVDKQKLRNETWLDWKYPPETRKEIKELDIRQKDLTGPLNLNDFVNLEKLNCASNSYLWKQPLYDGCFNYLDISNCEKLIELDCSANLQLSNLILPKKGKNLIKISTSCHYCSGASNSLDDLSIFSHLENLEKLDLHYNLLFVGSLEPLKNLTKLKWLNIEYTNLDSGIEYLPDSLEEYFGCENTRLSEVWDFSWNSRKSNDTNSRIRRWKTELPKKQIAARLIFNFWFWKAKKTYQRFKEELQAYEQQIQELKVQLAQFQKATAEITTQTPFLPFAEKATQVEELTSELFTREKKALSEKELVNLQAQLLMNGAELEELLDSIKNKINAYEQANQNEEYENHTILLNDLLDNQTTLTIYQNSPNITPNQIETVSKQLQWARNSLLHVLTKEELNQLCQIKSEIVKLELQIEQSQQVVNQQNNEQVAQIIQKEPYGTASSNKLS